MAPVTSAQNYFAILCWNLTSPLPTDPRSSNLVQFKPCTIHGGTPFAVPVFPGSGPPDSAAAFVYQLSGEINSTRSDVGGSRHRSAELEARDKHALLYIVVVLLFYSTGIVVAIVMYLKREKADIEEEKAYDDYARFQLLLDLFLFHRCLIRPK